MSGEPNLGGRNHVFHVYIYKGIDTYQKYCDRIFDLIPPKK